MQIYYAQTIAYALFTARVFKFVRNKRERTKETFFWELAWQQLPEVQPFLRQLFKNVFERQARLSDYSSFSNALLQLVD
ncbi:hypothetical protein ABN584_07975 [Gloeocapsa sp. BRSZ]